MSKRTGKATKNAPISKTNPIDRSQYGEAATGSFGQPFWDQAYDASEKLLIDEEGDSFGIKGALLGDSPWDRVRLNGNYLPGLWEATATPAIQLDVQKPNGFDGAALVSRGYVPAGITLTGRIWTSEQWTEFQRILPTFWGIPNHYATNDVKRDSGQVIGEQRSVQVFHPGLAAFHIDTLVIRQITPPEPTGEKGVRQIKIIAVEYVPEPQKKPAANKKVEGVGKQIDMGIQSKIIAARHAALGSRVSSVNNLPQPPSIAQGNTP
jgi:hypothetical protein